MKLKKINEQPVNQPYEKLIQDLNGYWENDQWDALECPLYTKELKINKQKIKFNQALNPGVKQEFKYYFFRRLTDSELQMTTIWKSSSALNKLQEFILKFYPNICSILDIPYEKFSIHFKTYLFECGCSVLTVKGYLQLYNRINSFFFDWYDERDEKEKDIWDVRKLGIDYNNSNYSYTLNFNSVPTPFRTLIKRYIEKRVLVQESLSWGSAIQNIAKLQEFSKHIHRKYPNVEKGGDILNINIGFHEFYNDEASQHFVKNLENIKEQNKLDKSDVFYNYYARSYKAWEKLFNSYL